MDHRSRGRIWADVSAGPGLGVRGPCEKHPIGSSSPLRCNSLGGPVADLFSCRYAWGRVGEFSHTRGKCAARVARRGSSIIVPEGLWRNNAGWGERSPA